MSEWEDLRWFLVLNGIADAWMWAFDADRWELRFGHPAMGSMGILPRPGDSVATLSDALWLADAVAFDHDAPVANLSAAPPGSGMSDALSHELASVKPQDSRPWQLDSSPNHDRENIRWMGYSKTGVSAQIMSISGFSRISG